MRRAFAPGEADVTTGAGDRLGRRLAERSPLRWLVRRVASIRASVHAKLLAGFLLVVALFFAMGALNLQTMARSSRHLRLLAEAQRRVDESGRIQHALAMQLNFTGMALILRDEASIATVLRENNRFNSTLARLEAVATEHERAVFQKIRVLQDVVMATVADIANLIRDGQPDAATSLQLSNGYPLYREIERLVQQIVAAEAGRIAQLQDEATAANRRALVLAGGFLAAAVGLALGLGFVISWSLILPVREAGAFLDRVARGEFGATIAVPNRDEFGALAQRMNHMSRELERLYDAERQTAGQLRALNERLAQASKAKSDFLASMSHELRTPMNAILGFTELLLDGVYGELPEHVREPLADVQTNGRHLLRLINEVLDLSKIEAGRLELNVAEYAPADVVAVVLTSLRSLAEEKGLEFRTSVAADVPPARGDAGRLTQCLLNLTGNALKFTSQGWVEVSVACRDGELLYRVSDTGIGIPVDQQAHIFDEFRQADATVAREFGGTGLGLSITRRFVELHGGRIWVESEPGRGSTFAFAVPVAADGRSRP